jgi:hypothetical protein
MKRTVFLLAVLLTTAATTVWSQGLQFGVKAGLNVSTLTGDGDFKYKPGFVVGVTLDAPLASDVYLLTGLELSQKGAKQELLGIKASTSPLYIQLPVKVGYKIEIADGTYFVPQAGPYVAYGVGGKSSIAGIKTDAFGDDGTFKNFDFGLGVGFGLDLDHFNLTIGYDIGLTNIAKDIPLIKYSEKNGNLFVTLGYKF